jgi:hypothetical protein
MTSETSTINRTLITKNYLGPVITCMEKKGYEIHDFEISTERVQSYTDGHLDPKSIIYVFRISTGIEINYALDGKPNFSEAFCTDLKKRTFDSTLEQ